MTKFRLLLVTMLAALAVGALASASASAAECVTLTEATCLAVLTATKVTELLTEEEFLDHKKAGSTSKLTVAGIGSVVCNKAESSGKLDETETGILILKLVITFSEGCKLEGHASCKITEPIVTSAIGGTFTTAAGVGTATFKPEVGEEFAKVTIAGCEQEAIIKVTGSQKCKSTGIETEGETHELVCLPTESSLKDGTKTAEFELTDIIELESKKPFAFLEKLF